MISVGSIVRASFASLRRNIVALAVWCLIGVALSLVMQAVMRSSFHAANSFGEMAPAPPSGAWMLLLALPNLTLLLVIWTAMLRANFRPDQDRAAYMRLGADEGRQFGAALMLIGMVVAAWVAIVFLTVILGVTLTTAIGKGAAAVVVLLLMIAAFGATLFAWIRLSPVGPLTLLNDAISIPQAWRLSHGRFWTLFGAYLVFGLISLVAVTPLLLMQLGPIWSDMLHPMAPGAAERLAAFQATQLNGPLTARVVIVAIVSGALNTLLIAVRASTASAATAQLLNAAAGEA